MMKRNDPCLHDAFETIESMMSNVSKAELERDDFLTDIAAQLINLRLELEKTQAEAAEQCGITQAMVSKMEGGLYNPSVARLWDYVNKLGGGIKLEISLSEENEYSIRFDEGIIGYNEKERFSEITNMKNMFSVSESHSSGDWDTVAEAC